MFLRHMNRVLVGTMLDVAAGRTALEHFAAPAAGPPARRGRRTAPAHGLALAQFATRLTAVPGPERTATAPMLDEQMLNVLLTNDDGIEADGLQAMRGALAALDGVSLAVIAPDGNRSAMARSITTRRPLWVAEAPFADGTVGYATDGTPVDCVRLASLGLIEGFEADLVVAGINHGANLGDDITYSGTVAAALEGVVLGSAVDRRLPAVAERGRSTTASTAASASRSRPTSSRGWCSGSRTCRCRRRRCSTSTCPAASRAASR